MLSILCSTRQIADEALLGNAELGEGELERLMATREYSEMRVKGKFGRGSGGVCPGWRCWKLDVKLTIVKILRIGFGVFFFLPLCFVFFLESIHIFVALRSYSVIHGNLYWAIPHFETQVILVDSEGWSWESLENQCDFEKWWGFTLLMQCCHFFWCNSPPRNLSQFLVNKTASCLLFVC